MKKVFIVSTLMLYQILGTKDIAAINSSELPQNPSENTQAPLNFPREAERRIGFTEQEIDEFRNLIYDINTPDSQDIVDNIRVYGQLLRTSRNIFTILGRRSEQLERNARILQQNEREATNNETVRRNQNTLRRIEDGISTLQTAVTAWQANLSEVWEGNRHLLDDCLRHQLSEVRDGLTGSIDRLNWLYETVVNFDINYENIIRNDATDHNTIPPRIEENPQEMPRRAMNRCCNIW